MERRARLGDVIDDYCTRCRMIMNHGIVGMVGDDVAKVRCNTCQSEHTYKHGRIPKRRRGETDRLFAEVLRGIRGDPDPAAAAEPDEEPEAASGEKSEPGATVTGRTGAAGRQARAAAGQPKAAPKAAARQGRKGAAAAGGKTTRRRGRKSDEDEKPEEHEEPAADLEGRADAEMDADAGVDSGTGEEAQQAAPQAEDSSAAPERDEDSEPTHGVRRKLFTIRRHSGGKPPVAGVTTDGSAERAARGQGQQQGGQARFGRGGPGGGGRHGHGGHGGGGHGGGGGRPDQQGRWPRRHRRRG